jgi:hypothetical protein
MLAAGAVARGVVAHGASEEEGLPDGKARLRPARSLTEDGEAANTTVSPDAVPASLLDAPLRATSHACLMAGMARPLTERVEVSNATASPDEVLASLLDTTMSMSMQSSSFLVAMHLTPNSRSSLPLAWRVPPLFCMCRISPPSSAYVYPGRVTRHRRGSLGPLFFWGGGLAIGLACQRECRW